MLRKTVALRTIALLWCTIFLLMAGQRVQGQSFGIESHNTLMPASGGMAGASIARPQDVTSAMNANAATLAQFEGTQFVFGGFWGEPTYNLTQTAPLPLLGVDPYSAKSTAQGVAGANIGVTQSLEAMGMPATIGLGFISNAAGGVDFRHVPQSNRTNSAVTVLELAGSAGMQLTERLSVGATAFLGTGIFDGPFVGLGGLTTDYALRASLGLNYDLTDYTTIGAYYRTEQQFTFANAIQFGVGPTLDVNMDLPRNVGIGIANNALMDGRLLLAMDVLFINWENAELFEAIYNDQWVMQLGAQYSLDCYRLRLGYAYAENPVDPLPFGDLGGVFPPGGPAGLRYLQGLLAISSEHRISAGIGVVDVLPGVDLDLAAGGMFRDTEQLGPSTTTAISSYWIAFGLTWRFGPCCQTLPPCAECNSGGYAN